MLNRSEFIGYIGQKAEVKTLESGVKVAQFSIAITKKGYTSQTGAQIPEKTTWVNIVAWRQLADIIEKYTDRGSHIYVAGELTNRSYDDANGVKRYITEIVAEKVELLSHKPDQQQTAQNQPQDNSVQDWANQQPAGNSQSAANDFLSQGGAGTGSDLPF